MTDSFLCIACHHELDCKNVDRCVCIRCRADNSLLQQVLASKNNTMWKNFWQWKSNFPLALLAIVVTLIFPILFYLILTQFYGLPHSNLFFVLLILSTFASSLIPCRTITNRWFEFFEQYREKTYTPRGRTTKVLDVNTSILFSIAWVFLIVFTALISAPVLMPYLSHQITDFPGISEAIVPKDIISNLHNSIELALKDPNYDLPPVTFEYLRQLHYDLGIYLDQLPEEANKTESVANLIEDLKMVNGLFQSFPPELQEQITKVITQLEAHTKMISPVSQESIMPLEERQRFKTFYVSSILLMGLISIYLSWKSVGEFAIATNLKFNSYREKPIYHKLDRLLEVVKWDLMNTRILNKYQYNSACIDSIRPNPHLNRYQGLDITIRYNHPLRGIINLFVVTDRYGKIIGDINHFLIPRARLRIPHELELQTFELLHTLFNEDDLRCLCFTLNVTWENLNGNNKKSRCKSLVEDIVNQGRFQELNDLIKENRPSAFE